MATVTLTFKTTDVKARALRSAARAQKMTLSDYLRRAAEAAGEAPGGEVKKWDAVAHDQMNVRISAPAQAKVAKNARLLGQSPAEYVRGLIEREDELVTGVEIHRRALALIRARKAAGRPMSLKPAPAPAV